MYLNNEKLLNKTVKDIYEAAYYTTKGARLVGVKEKTVARNKRQKTGYKIKWIFRMEDIPSSAQRDWKEHRAEGNLREFKSARIKLKQKVKKYLGHKYEY